MRMPEVLVNKSVYPSACACATVGQKPGRTGHILDHHRLPEAAANTVREQTRHDVGRGARAGGNDQPDRPNRPRVAALSLSTRRKSEDYARDDNSQ
jgi:hypothetical protein